MTTLDALQHERLGRLFPWDRLDREAALARPDHLKLVREACLIESYFAVYTARMMRLLWYDVAATSILSIEAFEAYVHFATLRRYLDEVGFEPITDDEIRALRAKDIHGTAGAQTRINGIHSAHARGNGIHGEHARGNGIYGEHAEHRSNGADGEISDAADEELRELVNFMVTEHFAARFFRDLGAETDEPVLRAIMDRFSPEEDVHSDLAGELILARVGDREDLKDRVVKYARAFRHIGAYVLPGVSNVNGDNSAAIVALDRKIEALVGLRLTGVS